MNNKKIIRDWYLADAKNQILGRLSTKIARVLYGKGKKNFSPNIDLGDFVIVINAESVKLSGRKKESKVYQRHSGYPGGLKEESFLKLQERKPEEIIKKAVKGMLPKNKIASKAIKRLKVYRGGDYKEKNITPKELKFN